MANNFVQVPPNSTGLKMQTFENTVGLNTVESEAVTLVRASDNTEVGTSGQPLRTDPTGTTVQPVSGTVTANIGTTNGLALDATVSAVQSRVPVPATSGGTADFHLVSAGSNNATSVKGSAGQVYGWSIFNNAAYPIFVKLFNKVTAPVPGTDTPVRTIGVQAGTHVSLAKVMGMAFSLGVGIAIVKGIADNDNTAVLANDCVVDLDYK